MTRKIEYIICNHLSCHLQFSIVVTALHHELLKKASGELGPELLHPKCSSTDRHYYKSTLHAAHTKTSEADKLH